MQLSCIEDFSKSRGSLPQYFFAYCFWGVPPRSRRMLCAAGEGIPQQ
ncbi:hypothetical protein RMSM_01888 [Rhodopirellula maiorica SM1]|uniref:Uncharacterized protein n=1 Tax=Rhodopirellula maiorica SM1 TaxID=1265738 RepID=M5S0K8_9BACT|nr:hypothetical protein RMSM_01888 [Rhodopirellula maiorica SM1]